MGGGILRAKATAVLLGPEGFGTVSAVLQIPQLLFVPLGLVTGPALVSSLGRARARQEAGQLYNDTAATLVLFGGAVLGALSVLTGVYVFRDQPPVLVLFTALAAVGAMLDPLARIPNANLLARGEVRQYAVIMATTSVVVAVVASAATALAGLWGQFIAAAVMPAVLLLLFSGLWRRALPDMRLVPRPALDRDFLREAAAVGAATLVASIGLQGALSTIRWALWQQGGAESNGQFQAAWSVGSAYLGIVMQGLGTGVFPRYAAATRESLPAEVDAAAKFVFDAAPPLILIAIAVREPMVHLLYSGEFDRAGTMLGYQMAADLAKALSFVYAGVLLFRGEVRAYLVTEVLGASLLGVSALVLVPLFGEIGASYAYAITYSLYVVIAAVALSRACDVSVRWRPVVLALVFTAGATGAVEVTGHWPMLRWVLLGVGCLWAMRTGVAHLVWTRVWTKLSGSGPRR